MHTEGQPAFPNDRLGQNHEIEDRMDRVDLEPRDRLHENQPWVQELLRKDDVDAAESDGNREVLKRVPADDARGCIGSSTLVEEAANDICEFDE